MANFRRSSARPIPRSSMCWCCRHRCSSTHGNSICDSGPYKLYRIVDLQDTDDFSYSLDPPFYNRGARLGCDGKAGRGMQTVAVNCRPL